jgi:hypothetical protein
MTILTHFTIDLAQFAMSPEALEVFAEYDRYTTLGSVETCSMSGSVMTLGFDLGLDEPLDVFGSRYVCLSEAFALDTLEMVEQAKLEAAE